MAVLPSTGAEAVLDRLVRPYDPADVLAALVGVPVRLARQTLGAAMATSTEAEDLLTAMPQILRSLAIATTDRPERCYGELRGPVLWSETMSSRSASAGDPGLFVCATTTKAYDNDENRVLKAAIDIVAASGRIAEAAGPVTEELARSARHNGNRANRLLEHQTLAAVPVVRPSGRQLRRTRAGSRRNTYRPPLDVLRLAADPLDGEIVRSLAEPTTLTQIRLLATVLDAVEGVTGGERRSLRHQHGALVAGPVRYDHLDGVLVHGRRVDSPEEAAAIAAAG
ncbi:MAG: hypothetical protein ACSLFP_14875 [Acidimicrobiales bacterium]